MSVSFVVQYRTLQSGSQLLQKKIQDANYELTTGKKSDMVETLQGRVENYLDIRSISETFDKRQSRFTAASNKMEVTQKSLDSVRSFSNALLSSLESSNETANSSAINLVRHQAIKTLDDYQGVLNAQWGNVSLFAGDASENPAVSDMGNLVTIAKNLISTYLGGGGQLQTQADIDTVLSEINSIFDNTNPTPANTFNGAIYQGGTGDLAGVEVYNNEVVTYGMKANDPLLMKVIKGAVILATSDIIEQNSTVDLRRYYTRKGLDALRDGNQDVVEAQAQVGTVQQRIETISDGMDISNTYFKTKVSDMESADPKEATTNLASFQLQLQAAYYAISQIKSLSLVNYLH
jgi:flagellar hook-associated protein 3 FlgL